MKQETKLYLDAAEISKLLGISLGSAYRIIRQLNAELAKDGFIVVAGKLPCRYFEKRWYGGCGA